LIFTARCARAAEVAEMMVFSFAVERTAKENYSAAELQKTHNLKIICNSGSNKTRCALYASAVNNLMI
jgi:hypothetical protein